MAVSLIDEITKITGWQWKEIHSPSEEEPDFEVLDELRCSRGVTAKGEEYPFYHTKDYVYAPDIYGAPNIYFLSSGGYAVGSNECGFDYFDTGDQVVSLFEKG